MNVKNSHTSFSSSHLVLLNHEISIIIIIYRFLERHILKALWRFTILKINKKLQKTIKSLSKKKGLSHYKVIFALPML